MNNKQRETIMKAIDNGLQDISDNQLFSMFNRNTDPSTKSRIKKELRHRGYFALSPSKRR